MLRSNTRKGLGLVFLNAVVMKDAGVVNTIVAVELLDRYAGQVPTQLFKTCFPHNHLACSHACLTFNIDKAGSSVSVQGAAVKTTIRSFTAISVKTSSRSVNDKLICEDFIPRFILIELENAFLCCTTSWVTVEKKF